MYFYSLVLSTLTPLLQTEPTRKCFRLIGGTLVERTVSEVEPDLKGNLLGVSYCRSIELARGPQVRSECYLGALSAAKTANPDVIRPIASRTVANPSSLPSHFLLYHLWHLNHVNALLRSPKRSKMHWNNSSRRTRRKKMNSKSSRKSLTSRSVLERCGVG